MASSLPFPWRLLLLLHLLCSHVIPYTDAFVGTYGVNYGRIADNLPPPESVVTLIKAAKIGNVKIYDADHSVLAAFKGSGIDLMVGIGNERLVDMAVSEAGAVDWVKENVEPFLPGTRIRGIAVGNEVLGGEGGSEAALLPAMRNVHASLVRLNLTESVQVVTTHSQAVFSVSFPPSACLFKDAVLLHMTPLLRFLSAVGSPFHINAYPFLAYMADPAHISLDYVLFRNNPGVVDANTKLHYHNMLEAQIDAAYAALEGAGFKKMEVVVSETGWASRGGPGETAAVIRNAREYNLNLRRRLAKRRGTPSRPNVMVKAYVFSLFNEDLKPGPLSERNFGLFRADGSISYDVGFTGLIPRSGAAFETGMRMKRVVYNGLIFLLLHVVVLIN